MRRTGNMTRGAMAACGQAKRVYAVRSALLLLVMLCGVALACIPMDFRNSTSNEHSPKVPLFVEVHLNAAYAYDVSDAPYASALLTNYAESAGLTDNEFVVTVFNALTASTGANLLDATRDVSWSFADNLASNLDSLTDAADYPAWDTLSDADKTAYGNKENYDKSKFNSLLDAFGFGETTNGFYSSGGGTFEPETGILRKLEQLGNIGRNWINGAGNTLNDLTGLNSTQVLAVLSAFNAGEGDVTIGAENYENWPDGVGNIIYSIVDRYSFYVPNRNNWYIWKFDRPVYLMVFDTGAGRDAYAFSDTSFKQGSSLGVEPSTFYDASNRYISAYGKRYYYAVLGYGAQGINQDSVSVNTDTLSSNVINQQIIPLILWGVMKMGTFSKIPEYPTVTPSGDTLIFAPSTVNNTTNNWNNYITQPVQPRPENPYNPDNQTGGNQWREDTTDNVMPLMGIRFDNLFPFSLVFDLPKLSNKVSELTLGQATSGVYDTVRIPIVAGDIDEQLELDLTPLRQLLNMFRPFVFVLVLVTMVMSLVLFWKSILTGD